MVRWAETLENLANLPVLGRARGSLTFDLGGGVRRSDCVGRRIHFEQAPGSGVWLPIDTAIRDIGGGAWGGYGTPARIDGDGTASIEGGTYSQRTLRIGRYRPSTQGLAGMVNVPVGRTVEGDSVVAAGAIGSNSAPWEHRLTLTEDGLRETLTLFDLPQIGGTQATDWLVLETRLTGITFPNGWLDEEYQQDGMRFPLPVAHDAAGKRPPQTRRYARTVSGAQYLYTGIPVSWLASPARVFPIVIDPDYAGTTADWWIYGHDGSSFANARTGSDYLETGGASGYCGVE
jgi:hypothetical protein